MNLFTVARLEFVGVARLKWIRLLIAAFALLTTAAAYSAGTAAELSGADGFERTTMTLVPVVLILVPLAALVLGVSGQSAESGGEDFLFAQPLGRATILIGRWLGEAAALGCTIGAGFGLGALLMAFSSGTAGLLRFASFVAAAGALALIFLSIAAAIASTTETRVTALGVGTSAWFFFVLLYDGAVLSLAGWLTGRSVDVCSSRRSSAIRWTSSASRCSRWRALRMCSVPRVRPGCGSLAEQSTRRPRWSPLSPCGRRCRLHSPPSR